MSIGTVPVRIALRKVADADAEAIHGLLSDECVIRHMLFPRFSHERACQFARQVSGDEPSGSPPQLVRGIAMNGERPLVGLCGLVLDSAGLQGEAWYLLRPDLWGRGIATVAARTLVEHAFGPMELHRVWARATPENPASARVLEKLGFRHEGVQRQSLRIHESWRDSHTYALLRDEWRQRCAQETNSSSRSQP